MARVREEVVHPNKGEQRTEVERIWLLWRFRGEQGRWDAQPKGTRRSLGSSTNAGGNSERGLGDVNGEHRRKV